MNDRLNRPERHEFDTYIKNLSDDSALDMLEVMLSGHTDDLGEYMSSTSNYRFLFGDRYNSHSGFRSTVESALKKEIDNYTPPSFFKSLPRAELEEYAKGVGLSPEKLLKEGEKYTTIIRNPDFIDPIRDLLVNMPLETAEDFTVFNNMMEYGKHYMSMGKNSYGSFMKSDLYDIFNERGNLLRRKGMAEQYVTNKLTEIQNLAQEYGYDYDLKNVINDRISANKTHKEYGHEAHKTNREQWIKYKRINELEDELKKFKKGSPEYTALEKEIHNLTVDVSDPELGWEHQTLELPPPREGAPMFEGGAVPSIIADSDAGANTPNTSGAGGGGNQPPQTTTAASEAGKPRRRGQRHLTPEEYEIIYGSKPYYRESFNDATSQFKGEVPPPEDPKITQAVDEWMKEDAVKQQRQLDMNNTDYNLQHHPEIYNNHSDYNANFSEEMYKEYEKTHGKPYGSTVQSNDPHNTTQRVVDQAIDNKHVENQYDNQKFNTQEQVHNQVNNNTTQNTTINNNKNTNTMDTNKPDPTIYTQEDDKAFKDHMENIKKNHDAQLNTDMDNDAIDMIEQMYQNRQLTDQQYADALNNVNERRKYIEEQSLPMDERLERVEQRYASGEYDDKRYATELNKIYESNDVPTMTPEQAERNLPLDSRLERVERLYAERKFDDTQYADALNKIYSDVDVPTMTPEMARRKQTSQNSTKYKNVFEQFHAENGTVQPHVQPGPTNPIIDNNLPIPQPPIQTGPKMNTDPVPLNNAIENVIERNRPKTSKFGTVMSAFNLAMSAKAAVDTYKKSRAEGRGAVNSAVRAGGSALITNSLGPISSVLVPMAYAAPGAIMSGMDMLHKEYRRMNSSSNFIPFGKAEFQDSQDLATMRQAGMELAKMSRYNLEQTLMGAEAKHLHR